MYVVAVWVAGIPMMVYFPSAPAVPTTALPVASSTGLPVLSRTARVAPLTFAPPASVLPTVLSKMRPLIVARIGVRVNVTGTPPCAEPSPVVVLGRTLTSVVYGASGAMAARYSGFP